MTWAVALAFAVPFALFLAFIFAIRRAVLSAAVKPLAQTDQIENEGKGALEGAEKQAQNAKQEVDHASGDDLRRLGIRRLFRIK